MTVSTTSNRIVYTGNGSTTAFAFPYKFIATADLKVYVGGVLQTTGYTVGTPSDTGANVTFSSAPANGAAIVILSDPARLQGTSLPSTGPFPAKSVETMADKLTLLVQRLYDLASRSLTLNDADSTTVNMTLPTPAASNVIGWDSTGTALQSIPLSSLATSIAYGTARSDIFTGDGSTKTFTLSANPGAQANLDVAIAGVTQLPGTDYTWTSGTSLVFSSAPPNGAKILARYMQSLAQGSSDSASAAYIQSGTGAVQSTVQDALRHLDVCVFDFMTAAQISAVISYTFTTDVTTACQSALNAAHASKRNLFFPAGGYLVTSLTIPGTVDGVSVDDRDKAFRIYGQGFGEPFVHLNTGGTVIKSVSNSPVIKDIQGTVYSSNGTVEVDHIRFDGTSTTPVVLLDSFYGMSSFHDCVIYQRGTGSGLRITYGATWHVHHCYAMNKDWNSYALGASRTGIGFDVPVSYDNGLQTISKCSSRGWLTAYQLGGGAGVMYSPTIQHCECSVVYNGIMLYGTRKAIVEGNYLEGGDGGLGIYDEGNYSTIQNNLVFPGFAKGIDASNTSTQGTLIQGNIVATGAVANAIGIDVQSTASFGGYNKNVVNNSINYTVGTAGVSGIRIQGTDPRINVLGNMFDPRGAWSGAGTNKINDASSNGVYGLIQKQVSSLEIPVLSRGALSLQEGASALTQANVSVNTLTIPDAGSYFSCNATSACIVQIFSAGATPGRFVTFRTDTANMTFQDTAYIQLAGGVSFTGPGTITFIIDRIGGSNYAWEIARTVF